jgi:glycerol transport system ATP-binding protein
MARIRLDGVGFTYPGADAATLAPLSMDISHGEAFSLLGASGAGKTTLLNLLSGILQPTQGRIYFDDVDVTGLPGRARHLAQVFQFPVLYQSMTVGENLAFPLTTRGLNRNPADIALRVKAVAEELNIEGILNRGASGISLFEKQLVAIGRALVRPDVSMVLLDEPLTAVEPSVKWRLRQTLKQAQRDLGVTMVYVTHDQTEALTFAERVAVLADGEILQTGSPEDVYQNPAHEFVGHFLGSPGMNFLPVAELPETLRHRLKHQGDPERLGFRPESAKLSPAGAFDLTGVVSSRRILGTQQGDVISMYGLQCGDHSVFVRSSASQVVGDPVSIDLRHWVGFRNGILVGRHGAE